MNALEMALEALTNPSTIATMHAIELIKQELAKPKQEPVGYFYLRKSVFFHIYEPHNADPEVFPLYTAPPRKPWVNLTDDEVYEIANFCKDQPFNLYAKEIENKLRSKNAV